MPLQDINNNNKKDKKSKTPEWSYNNRTEQEYTDKGVEKQIPEYLNQEVKRFLSEVDPKGKYPIIRSVKTIIRCMAPDYSDKYQTSKEYLYYYEQYDGQDWLGSPIAPVTDHLQGVFDSPTVMHKYDKYGDIIEGADRVMGTRMIYYIPFSKEAVDNIIKTSDNTDKNNIRFVLKGPQYRTGGYTYEQFVNSSWDLMQEMAMCNGGPEKFDYWNRHDVKQRQENFKKYQQVT